MDSLVAEAMAGVNLDDLGGDDWVEPLTVLLASAEADADLHVVGRWRFRENVLHLLRTRLKMVAAMAADSTIGDESVTAPIIVTGSPRSGTSILHELLALDPTLRAPRGWEFWLPVPSPRGTETADARIAMADRELRLTAQLAPAFDGMHQMSSTTTRECGAAHALSFRSEDLDGNYAVRSYARWLQTADKSPAMLWHRRALQLLQHRIPTPTWVLKNPAYLGWMDEVVATYPDARLVVTHRDPIGMLSSVTSLYAALHGAHSNGVDMKQLAHDLVDRHAGLLNGLVDWVDAHPTMPVHHVVYDQFMTDPVSTIATIHDAIGHRMSDDTGAAIRKHLAVHPQGGAGGHLHSFGRLGLDKADVRRRFARYQERFDVASES